MFVERGRSTSRSFQQFDVDGLRELYVVEVNLSDVMLQLLFPQT